MPRTRKTKPTDVAEDVLDHVAGPARPMSPADVDAVMRRFKKALVERMLGGELTHHLGYPPGGTKPSDNPHQRNGTGGKTVLTEEGPLDLDIPRDRDGTFEPQLIPKHVRRFTGFDERRTGEVTAWQTRPREPMYPVVFFDALRVKIRDEAPVRSKAIYLALAVLPDGSRDILGIWIEQTDGAKFWMKVFSDLTVRGCRDILIAVTDGLKGMSEALAAVFPETTLQTCIVHLIRQSLDFADWKERRPLAAALRTIYGAPSAEAAGAALDVFDRGSWGQQFPTVVAAWRRAWTHVIPFFAFPPEVRKVYTTNALESAHAQLRKIIKTRWHFPNDEAATKLIWLALRNITAKWQRGAHHWQAAMNQFAILYEGRFTKPAV